MLSFAYSSIEPEDHPFSRLYRTSDQVTLFHISDEPSVSIAKRTRLVNRPLSFAGVMQSGIVVANCARTQEVVSRAPDRRADQSLLHAQVMDPHRFLLPPVIGFGPRRNRS